MAIRFACSCGKTLKVADDLSGRDITCPSCGRSVTVPTPEEAEQLEVAPLEDFDDGSPEGPSDPDSGRPADMAEAARESRRAAHRDRRRDAPVRPGKARLSADQRREAREGIREERKRRRESRKGVARPGKVRPSAEARREAKQGLREEGKRRRESRRGVPRGGRISAEAAREARAGLDEEERRRRESSRLVKGGAPRGAPAAAPVGGPSAGPFATPPFCPSCRAAAVPGAKICTICGLNFMTGTRISAREPILSRIPWRSLIGPLVALVLVWIGYVYVAKPIIDKARGKKPEKAPEEAPSARGAGKKPATSKDAKGPAAAPGKEKPEPPEPPKYSAAAFAGGVIPPKEQVTFSDTSAVYDLKKAIVIDGGATLKVAAGVRLKGKEINLAGGTLHIAGSPESPVTIDSIISNRRGPATEFVAEHAYFRQAVTIFSCKRAAIKNCTFDRSLRLEPMRMGATGKFYYNVSDCELKDEKAAVVLKALYTSERLQMRVRRCNIFGPVVIWSDLFSKVEVTDCHYPKGSDFRPRKADGRIVLEPKAEKMFEGIGAGTAAATGSSTGGSIWAAETTADDADRLVSARNTKLGFSIEFPGDWKTATNGERVTGPKKFERPSVVVKRHEEARHPDDAINAMVMGLHAKGVKAVKASHITRTHHPAGEAKEKMVSYDFGGYRWRKKFVSVSSGGKVFIIIGTYREDKSIEVGSTVNNVILSFKFM